MYYFDLGGLRPCAPALPEARKTMRVTPLVTAEELVTCAAAGHRIRPGCNQHGWHWTCMTCSVHAYAAFPHPGARERQHASARGVPATLVALIPQ